MNTVIEVTAAILNECVHDWRVDETHLMQRGEVHIDYTCRKCKERWCNLVNEDNDSPSPPPEFGRGNMPNAKYRDDQ